MQNARESEGAPRPTLLFALVLAIATSGLIYELSLAAVASYLLGDTVHQFSLVIGVYLSALGVGTSVDELRRVGDQWLIAHRRISLQP